MFRAGAVLILAVFIAAFTPIPPRSNQAPTQQQATATDNHQNVTAADKDAREPRLAAMPASISKHLNPAADSQARSVDHPQNDSFKSFWDFTLTDVLLVIFTAALVGVGYFQWDALKTQDIRIKESIEKAEIASAQQSLDMQASIAVARKAATAAEKSADLAIAAQRPWLDFEAAIASDMVLDDKILRFGVSITFNNIGSTPAIDTRAYWTALPEPLNRSLLSEAVAQAATVAGHVALRNFGNVIFPGKPEGMKIMVTIPRDIYDTAVGTGGGKTIALAIRTAYKFSGGEGTRNTAFVVWGRNHVEGGYGPLDLSKGPIPVTDVLLQKMPVHDIAT